MGEMLKFFVTNALFESYWNLPPAQRMNYFEAGYTLAKAAGTTLLYSKWSTGYKGKNYNVIFRPLLTSR